MPAQAEYSDSLPIGMPMPLDPRSPSPRMRSPSVTTIIATSRCGQLRSTCATLPRSSAVMKMPRGRRKMWPNSWQASPTVGV